MREGKLQHRPFGFIFPTRHKQRLVTVWIQASRQIDDVDRRATDVQPANDAKDLDSVLLEQIEHFFVSYNQVQGREYKPIKHGGIAMWRVEEIRALIAQLRR